MIPPWSDLDHVRALDSVNDVGRYVTHNVATVKHVFQYIQPRYPTQNHSAQSWFKSSPFGFCFAEMTISNGTITLDIWVRWHWCDVKIEHYLSGWLVSGGVTLVSTGRSRDSHRLHLALWWRLKGKVQSPLTGCRMWYIHSREQCWVWCVQSE